MNFIYHYDHTGRMNKYIKIYKYYYHFHYNVNNIIFSMLNIITNLLYVNRYSKFNFHLLLELMINQNVNSCVLFTIGRKDINYNRITLRYSEL